MEQSRNSACIVPDTMSFFDAEYGAYVGDLEYITNYMAQDVQRYYSMPIKPGKIALDMTLGLRPSLSNHVDNQANATSCAGNNHSSNSSCARHHRTVDANVAASTTKAATASAVNTARSMT